MSKQKNYSIKRFDTTKDYQNYINSEAGLWVSLTMDGETRKIEVVYDESQNREYNGEMYYAYIIVNVDVWYSKTLYTEGVYENQTVYLLYENGTLRPDDQYLYTFSVITNGYVEPHVSLCKDTKKVNYNFSSGEHYVTIRWNEGEPGSATFTINGTQYNIDGGSPVTVEYCPVMEITSSRLGFTVKDQDNNEIFVYDGRGSLPTSFAVPKGTTELILYGIVG